MNLCMKFSPEDVVLRDRVVGLLLRLPEMAQVIQIGEQWDVSIKSKLIGEGLECVVELPRTSDGFLRNRPVLHIPREWSLYISVGEEISITFLRRRDPSEKLVLSNA